MSSLQDSYMSERKAGVPKTRRQMMMRTNRTEPWLGALNWPGEKPGGCVENEPPGLSVCVCVCEYVRARTPPRG